MRGGALRRSAQLAADPSSSTTAEFQEPHRRGEIFVAAVMNGFLDVWAERIQDLGVPDQQSFGGARGRGGRGHRRHLATMWIRALDYMPPVHVEFGDALSAAAHRGPRGAPDDSRYRLREHMLEGVRRPTASSPPRAGEPRRALGPRPAGCATTACASSRCSTTRTRSSASSGRTASALELLRRGLHARCCRCARACASGPTASRCARRWRSTTRWPA